MKLLPHHVFEIASPLSREAALDAMRVHTEPVSMFRWRLPSAKNNKRFEGVMTADGFDVVREMGYQNSFVPSVKGVIQAAGAGSRIRVTMSLHQLTITALVIVTAAALVGMAFDPLTAAFVSALVYAVVYVGFWYEANKQERSLREIFREQPAARLPQIVS